MKQKTFEEIKEELLLRAKKAGACQIPVGGINLS